jgi:hypothetical protein
MTDPDVEVLETEPIPSAQGAVPQWQAKRKLAWTLAIIADVLQVALAPLAPVGVTASWIIDVVMAITMIRLLGWHPAFLPTALAEVIPLVNLVPTWTAAVWLVTRGQKSPAEMPRR